MRGQNDVRAGQDVRVTRTGRVRESSTLYGERRRIQSICMGRLGKIAQVGEGVNYTGRAWGSSTSSGRARESSGKT